MAEKLTETDLVTLKDFGSRLKALLKSLHLTQKEFAEAIEVAPYTVTLWVNGKVNITLTYLYKIIDFFHDSYPDNNAVISLFPDWVEVEHTNRENQQRKNVVNRLMNLPLKLRNEMLKQLGIKKWAELFDDPLIAEAKRLLKN